MVDFFVFISEILYTIQNDNPSDSPTAIKMATCELSKPNNCQLQCHRFFGSQSVFCSTNATRCLQCKSMASYTSEYFIPFSVVLLMSSLCYHRGLFYSFQTLKWVRPPNVGQVRKQTYKEFSFIVGGYHNGLESLAELPLLYSRESRWNYFEFLPQPLFLPKVKLKFT
uniref:Uncharacterized protein n=3 Tax=Micrurus TaxID=8634 RepID=A0A2H6N7N3_9SAUR